MELTLASLIGWLGNITIIVSFMMSGEKKIRQVNIIGSSFLLVYDIYLGLWSYMFLSLTVIILNVINLYKMKKKEK
ncbi:MAG: hypothetical protein EHM25_02705 [Nitrosopumilales archaeon]|nr:MAG: hypothetical protein EHM25_12475 [Nitrosopumilales archaeon]RPJ31564.1 MAG: hypothetical protein EHM25_02705 [Nitrosopumilales archaeon]